ncbi:hypothetical protein I6N90_10765 [Paenibacillus sp. GSMTC-2017]|uniref:glycoside hydrolase family 78 protein n=1 Tax=Paenibacillus sp. GSMTC-2017 TaxID=2794350 RepID=UPI0018D6DB86|nr:hypothetical protein [Paenibacillus sp. GSMTC-2017]MBH5318291.1 hypothetical protein [Paenibacillus sp. GSMTC-2017]
MKKFMLTMFILFMAILFRNDDVRAETSVITPTYETHVNEEIIDPYLYTDQASSDVTYNIQSKKGFIIKSIRWEKPDGTFLREASGTWVGKPSYTGKDTINGTEVVVKTARSHTYGGIYYWDRSGGSNVWRANVQDPKNVRYPTSSTCPYTSEEDEHGYRAFPNCSDELLYLILTKNGPYHFDGNEGLPFVKDKVVDVKTINVYDVKLDRDKRVDNEIYKNDNDPVKRWGKADLSTTYIRHEVLSKTSVRAYFKQNFKRDSWDAGYYNDWANPGARQMWYYSALKFRLEATTYRYKDKRLVVEWESEKNTMTEIKVRHMVRTGPTGSFVKSAESTTPLVEKLPHSRSLNADSIYGKVLGGNVSYINFNNSFQPGNLVTTTLNNTQKIAYVSFFYEKDPLQFSGDFDIIPSTINFRESFSFIPKDFAMNGCSYQSHRYKIERDGTVITRPFIGQTNKTTYTYSNYPWNIGVGVHMVSINIKTSCGESGWIADKPLTVNDIAGNNPPEFEIGFVYPSVRTLPLTEVIEGTILDLIYIDDPSVPTPIDPDGDSIEFMGFDTEYGSEFIRSLPEKYERVTEGYHNVKMDTLGYHYVKAQMRDQYGLTSTATTVIKVVPKNPVAIARCPAEVKTMRPIYSSFDSSKSYSPIGRKIDHAKDEWTNRLSTYINNTEKVQFERVQLNVYDSAGLKSLEPAECHIAVKPDLPPVALLNVTDLSLRNRAVAMINESFSPDGDQIVSTVLSYIHDANNDGQYSETAVPLKPESDGMYWLTPNKVGKYQFTLTVTENWGKMASAVYVLDVINDSPWVSFTAVSENVTPPAAGKSYAINPSDIMSNTWKSTTGGKSWSVDTVENSLSTVNLFISTEPGDVKNWQGISLNEATISNVKSFTGPDRIKLYLDYTLLEDTTPRDDSDLIVYKSGSEIRRLTKSRISHIDYDLGLIYIRNGAIEKDQVYSFKGLALNTPLTEVYARASWGCVYDTCFNQGGHKLLDTESLKFNHDLKQIYTTMTYNKWNKGKDYANLYSFNNPFLLSKKTELHSDLQEVGISVESTINNPLGYDSKGNLYYEAFDYHDGSPSSGYVFHNVFLAKLDGSTGEQSALYHDGGQTNWSHSSTKDGYAIGSRVVGNEDGSKIAYRYMRRSFSSYIDRLIVRDTNTGALLHQIEISETILSRHKNTIITKDHNYLRARDFNNPANIVWSVDIRNINSYIITTNGYFYYAKTRDSNLYNIDLANGHASSLNLSSFTYQSGNPSMSLTVLTDGSLKVSSGEKYILLSGPTPERSENYDLYGTLYSDSVPSLENFMYAYQLKFNFDSLSEERAGVSFRSKDHSFQNTYRVESSSESTRLIKIENGKRTILNEKAYMMEQHKYYNVMVQAINDSIKVYVNGVPIIDVLDTTFESEGEFGIFANTALVEMKNMKLTEMLSNKNKQYNIAVIDDPITFTTSVTDPENDPVIGVKSKWSYRHTNPTKFLDAGDGKSGLSALHDISIGTPKQPDKVGIYHLSYQTQDDPHLSYLYPNMLFDNYRKQSNLYTEQLLIHRKPIATFDVAQRPSDGHVLWTDYSYDPDRYLTLSNYSKEATGIDYKQTKGVLEKKFYYLSPSGDYVLEKLITPQETGLYKIGLAVRDEYGAWSNWAVKTLDVNITAVLNTPPSPGFTKSHTTAHRGTTVTINSLATDKEDGDRTKLKHTYYVRNKTTNGVETVFSSSRTSWTTSFNALGTYSFRQVVEDSHGATAQIEQEVKVINRKPTATITAPTSTNQDNPSKLTVLRPEFKWTYGDADNDVQKRYQVQIIRYGGYLVTDSESISGADNTWIPEVDLPEKTNMYVKVRVFDGIEWGEWSTVRYFYIETNVTPRADFSWSPQPIYEGDTVTFRSLVNDPDKDALSIRYELKSPTGVKTNTNYSFNDPYPNTGPVQPFVETGTWTMKLIVSDGKAAPVEVTKLISVLPLNVTGTVRHTDLWNKHRQQYNLKTSGEIESPRSYNVFWAGEKFLLYANTTETTTSTRANRVEVTIGKKTTHLMLVGDNTTSWSGELWDETFEKLEDGPITFTFSAYYNNGVIKVIRVEVVISGSVGQVVGVHRVK